MQNQWIYSSSFLPFTGEPIEFRLEEREQPLSGTFTDDVFHSRWADYGRSRVDSWRVLHDEASSSPTVALPSTTGSFSRIVKRMKSMISRSHGNELMALPRDEATTTTITTTTIALPATRAIKRGIDSNQMSS